MTDEPNPERLVVEEVHVAPEHEVTYIDMLNNIGQSVHEFRTIHGDIGDNELPVISTYELTGQTVSLLSNRASTITIQVSSETSRLSYVYDSSATYAVTINNFDNDSETPTKSLGLLPTKANARPLLLVHAYIQDCPRRSD